MLYSRTPGQFSSDKTSASGDQGRYEPGRQPSYRDQQDQYYRQEWQRSSQQQPQTTSQFAPSPDVIYRSWDPQSKSFLEILFPGWWEDTFVDPNRIDPEGAVLMRARMRLFNFLERLCKFHTGRWSDEEMQQELVSLDKSLLDVERDRISTPARKIIGEMRALVHASLVLLRKDKVVGQKFQEFVREVYQAGQEYANSLTAMAQQGAPDQQQTQQRARSAIERLWFVLRTLGSSAEGREIGMQLASLLRLFLYEAGDRAELAAKQVASQPAQGTQTQTQGQTWTQKAQDLLSGVAGQQKQPQQGEFGRQESQQPLQQGEQYGLLGRFTPSSGTRSLRQPSQQQPLQGQPPLQGQQQSSSFNLLGPVSTGASSTLPTQQQGQAFQQQQPLYASPQESSWSGQSIPIRFQGQQQQPGAMQGRTSISPGRESELEARLDAIVSIARAIFSRTARDPQLRQAMAELNSLFWQYETAVETSMRTAASRPGAQSHTQRAADLGVQLLKALLPAMDLSRLQQRFAEMHEIVRTHPQIQTFWQNLSRFVDLNLNRPETMNNPEFKNSITTLYREGEAAFSTVSEKTQIVWQDIYRMFNSSLDALKQDQELMNWLSAWQTLGGEFVYRTPDGSPRVSADNLYEIALAFAPSVAESLKFMAIPPILYEDESHKVLLDEVVLYTPELPPHAIETRLESFFRLDLMQLRNIREQGRFTIYLNNFKVLARRFKFAIHRKVFPTFKDKGHMSFVTPGRGINLELSFVHRNEFPFLSKAQAHCKIDQLRIDVHDDVEHDFLLRTGLSMAQATLKKKIQSAIEQSVQAQANSIANRVNFLIGQMTQYKGPQLLDDRWAARGMELASALGRREDYEHREDLGYTTKEDEDRRRSLWQEWERTSSKYGVSQTSTPTSGRRSLGGGQRFTPYEDASKRRDSFKDQQSQQQQQQPALSTPKFRQQSAHHQPQQGGLLGSSPQSQFRSMAQQEGAGQQFQRRW